MISGLTGEQLRASCAKLRSLLASGEHDDETQVAAKMGLSWADYEQLKKKLYDFETDALRARPTEAVYVDYVIAQTRNIKDLTDLYGTLKSSKQGSAAVGAIRARSDIYDKIIKTGQEFGFIERKPEAKIIAGVIVSQLTNIELRKAITGELSDLQRLMGMYGDESTIIDIEPGQIHQDLEPPKALPAPKQKAKAAAAPAGKIKGHKRNKVHGGRRVVKSKMDEAPI